jgi:hypothetical protein
MNNPFLGTQHSQKAATSWRHVYYLKNNVYCILMPKEIYLLTIYNI